MSNIINSDIYNLSKLVDDVKSQFIPEEAESTLNISTFGYFGAINAKRLQSQAIMTGELCNESFYSRARLDKNVVTHAISLNISNINAVPAKMDILLGIRELDLIPLLKSDTFIIDRSFPIFIGEFEFHLEYDIIIKQIKLASNEKVYTAQYDMTRLNTSSTISNPYINSPAIINLDNDKFIMINTIISQVEYYNEYTKLISSNSIDNKTVTFSFINQLAYFEVKATDGDEVLYLTPIFEGSGIPNDVGLYCWYQYINTDMIRVRFDRNSYMPSLNSEIEIMIKTTKGSLGNFTYASDLLTTFESTVYNYSNLTVMISPVSESDDGKDRKSKKELQKLLPKEALARGSLTTITDLNNYFDTLNSDQEKVIIQKKIDNQQERVYYAYLVLKDDNNDIVPSNTIDLKIPMTAMLKTEITDSSAPRYVLQSGKCFRLTNGICELVTKPIVDVGLKYLMPPLFKNNKVSIKFKARIIEEYNHVNINAIVEDAQSVYIESPLIPGSIYSDSLDTLPIINFIDDYISIGQKFQKNVKHTGTVNPFTIIQPLSEEIGYDTIENVYYLDQNGDKIYPEIIVTDTDLTINIHTPIDGFEYQFIYSLYVKDTAQDTAIDNKIVCKSATIENVNIEDDITMYITVLKLLNNPDTIPIGTVLEYELSFTCLQNNYIPNINCKLSRGTEYVPLSSTIAIDDGSEVKNFIFEPAVSNLRNEAGFLYTNPYTIVINNAVLYASFYMLCVNRNPFIQFNYINQKSIAQFIGTNISWIRPFLGYDNNRYKVRFTITQSIQEDIGLIINNGEGVDPTYKVKMIMLFYRDDKPYRYKNMELDVVDSSSYSFTFYTELMSEDIFDQDNNIKISNVGLLNQLEEEYGYFNANTKTLIYTLVELPDTSGAYTRYDLDSYVPGLDGWTVTNVYQVQNGLDFYFNYADVMNSRVNPYGETINNQLTAAGYTVQGVPMLGFDYANNETLVNSAVDYMNDQKANIDNVTTKTENSFGIDFKVFNTYGPSKTYYTDILADSYAFIDRVNIKISFRLKLQNINDNYTKDYIIRDVKEYIEDLDELGEIHIPNLITLITNTYKESIVYFEFLGINDLGPGVQHLYRLDDSQIPIHDCPEFININNSLQIDGTVSPDIYIQTETFN